MVSGPGSGSLTWAKVSRVVSAADGPLVGLLGEDGADEACDGGLVGEDAD